MKTGSRDEPGSRLYTEQQFRDGTIQVLVATEAAGEGINLQCCHILFNYDIPWNPNRLEQRMGRIHRYGQRRDCLIFNFVATNTIEGRVIRERLFTVELADDGPPVLCEPDVLSNFSPTAGPGDLPPVAARPEATAWLNANALLPFINEVCAERLAEVERIAKHIELSLTEVIQRADEEIGRAAEERDNNAIGAEGRLAQAEARHAEVMARRDRRRDEFKRQRALTLQGVERLASVLILPHPERETLDVRRLRPHPETEMTAMRVVMEYETAQGRQVEDVHKKNLGYDITSLDPASGKLRLIEIKGLAVATGPILLTPNERRVAEDRRDCYWLYVVTHCASAPQLQEPIENPVRFPWHEVTQVAHYYLSVDALKQPVEIREGQKTSEKWKTRDE